MRFRSHLPAIGVVTLLVTAGAWLLSTLPHDAPTRLPRSTYLLSGFLFGLVLSIAVLLPLSLIVENICRRASLSPKAPIALATLVFVAALASGALPSVLYYDYRYSEPVQILILASLVVSFTFGAYWLALPSRSARAKNGGA